MEVTPRMQQQASLPPPLLSDTRVFLGIGNPGEEYADTYHNAGELGVAVLAELAGEELPFRRPRGSGAIAVLERLPYRFVRSLVFMNESGRAAGEVTAKFGIKPSTLAVIHDDADLPVGTVLAAFGRGAAGHHGVMDIIRALGTNKFWRIRIGIRPDTEARLPHGTGGRRPAGDFVLNRMRANDRKAIVAAIEKLELLRPRQQ